MKNFEFIPKIVFTNRLVLLPFTTQICTEIRNNNFELITTLGLKKGINWPDLDILETLPKIITNLAKVNVPTGFESWMIIKKETNEIIGDLGFKGYQEQSHSCDIGYGLIEAERSNGYALEATQGLINWVLKNDASITITATTHISNNSSIKLLQKLNFIECNRDNTFIHWQLLK